MITGTVNPDREATIRLPVREREQQIEAVMDTGFNGFVTLPLAVIIALGLYPMALVEVIKSGEEAR